MSPIVSSISASCSNKVFSYLSENRLPNNIGASAISLEL